MAIGDGITGMDRKVLSAGVIAFLVAAAAFAAFAVTGWWIAKAILALAVTTGVITVCVELFRAWWPRDET
jgi:divalent metal cation (Fe/Co/Zn/Cd) transporter